MPQQHDDIMSAIQNYLGGDYPDERQILSPSSQVAQLVPAEQEEEVTVSKPARPQSSSTGLCRESRMDGNTVCA